MPDMPDALESHRTVPMGRMRSRCAGSCRDGVPEVVVVMGMAVADYLMPAVAAWLEASELRSVVLVGHSSGTQVAAHAAALSPQRVAALVLASPTVDPVARSWLRLLVRWRLDGRHEPPGLTESHRREWRRAGARRLFHLVRTHLHDRLETTVAAVGVPVMILRGR